MDVLGDTDAMDFYHRKAKGVQNRRSGKMERPDEAKRKEISIAKREDQRQKQMKAQEGGEGKKSGGKGKVKGAGKGDDGGNGKGRGKGTGKGGNKKR